MGERLKKRKKAIKAILLDQSLFAGIGNWLADEILFQSRISPHHLASDLSMAQIKKLHTQTLAVVKKAVKVHADYEQFPKTWLFHDRWGKTKGAKTSRGKILHEEIGNYRQLLTHFKTPFLVQAKRYEFLSIVFFNSSTKSHEIRRLPIVDTVVS